MSLLQFAKLTISAHIVPHSTLMLAKRQSDNTKRAGRLTIDVKSGKVDER